MSPRCSSLNMEDSGGQDLISHWELYRHSFKRVVSGAVTCLLLGSCSISGAVDPTSVSDASGPPSETQTVLSDASASGSPAAAGQVFEGTPEEYAALTRACLEDRGLRTIDDPMGDEKGFGVDMSGLSAAEVEEAFDSCEQQVGIPKMVDLSQSELQERYDARVEQHSCLVREGYQVDPAPSFDTFVDEYQRSGQQSMWEPAALPNPQPGDNPTTDCPRVGQW